MKLKIKLLLALGAGIISAIVGETYAFYYAPTLNALPFADAYVAGHCMYLIFLVTVLGVLILFKDKK